MLQKCLRFRKLGAAPPMYCSVAVTPSRQAARGLNNTKYIRKPREEGSTTWESGISKNGGPAAPNEHRAQRLLASFDVTTGPRKEHICVMIMTKSCRLSISNHTSLKKTRFWGQYLNKKGWPTGSGIKPMAGTHFTLYLPQNAGIWGHALNVLSLQHLSEFWEGWPGERQQTMNYFNHTPIWVRLLAEEPTEVFTSSYTPCTWFFISSAAGTAGSCGKVYPKSEKDFSSSYPQSICRWLLHCQSSL